MIICPNCKEEIDDDSHYCDQCGQALLFCEQCGRVGMGRRCTHCGGLMVSAEEHEQASAGRPAMPMSHQPMAAGPISQAMPVLTLINQSMNLQIVGINGGIIGRRQGPYVQYFQQFMFVSGVHAQLNYRPNMGWTVTDKHSSNGTKVNELSLTPDVETPLRPGDVLTIANISFEVTLK